MLILSRKAGESLILDGGIEIKITEIYGDKVRIGIDAPPQVKVYRKELYATIQENQSAAMAAPRRGGEELPSKDEAPGGRSYSPGASHPGETGAVGPLSAGGGKALLAARLSSWRHSSSRRWLSPKRSRMRHR